MDKILLKPSEVAKLLGIGRSLTYDLIARREMPSVRLGRSLRVPKESLLKWLENKEKQNDARE